EGLPHLPVATDLFGREVRSWADLRDDSRFWKPNLTRGQKGAQLYNEGEVKLPFPGNPDMLKIQSSPKKSLPIGPLAWQPPRPPPWWTPFASTACWTRRSFKTSRLSRPTSPTRKHLRVS